MADLICTYTLTTPGGTIVFNDGDLHTLDDLYWITLIQGLDGAPLRTPIDNAPQADGGLVHGFFKAARAISFEGVILTQSAPFGDACQIIRNTMEDALVLALNSIRVSNGTLSWTPTGGSARSLTVRNNVPIDYTPIEDYALDQFTFGLIAANPNW